jgi:hypothetical protein
MSISMLSTLSSKEKNILLPIHLQILEKKRKRSESTNSSPVKKAKISESVGSTSTAEGKGKELNDSAESKDKYEQRPSKEQVFMNMASMNMDPERIMIILEAAVSHVSDCPRRPLCETLAESDSKLIVQNKLSETGITAVEVYKLLEEFYFDFEAFCVYNADHPNLIAKQTVKFCPMCGSICPMTSQYESITNVILKQHQHVQKYYTLLKNIFHFTWEKHFGPESKFAIRQKNEASTSKCSTCEWTQDDFICTDDLLSTLE